MLDRLKRFGETAGAVIAICALLAAFVRLTGGALPPWPSVREVQAAEAQQSQITATLNLLQRDYYSDRLESVQRELREHPDNESAKREARELEYKLRVIDSQLMAIAPGAGAPPK